MANPVNLFSEVEALVREVGGPALDLLEATKSISDPEERSKAIWTALRPLLLQAESSALFRHGLPVSCREFFLSPHFMNAEGRLYPELLRCLEEINAWAYTQELGIRGRYTEVVFTGSIGSGKTTGALYTQAYQLYLLSCLREPHALFDLDPNSEIEIIFQSAREALAREVDYMRFRSMIDSSPYFKKFFPYDPTYLSKLKFPNRIIVKPVSSTELGTLGQNVIGGVIDELNFMAMVEGSKRARGDEVYDQAVTLYNSIARRRESRFMVHGWIPGMLCLVSSRRFPGQFTDRKEEEAKRNPHIYIYDKRIWDLRPDAFSGKKFRVFAGDPLRKPRILDKGERVGEQDRSLVSEVPEEFRASFENDIMNALRDIAGISTVAVHPFMFDPEPVVEAFGKVESVFNRESCDFEDTLLSIFPKRIQHPTEPRYAHIDLAVTSDSAGLAIAHVPGFVVCARAEGDAELLPQIVFDGVLEIRPPRSGEILFERVRSILYRLREMGMPIRWVSLDSYQSTDTVQILRHRGFVSGVLSVDKKSLPYDVAKQAFYDRRVLVPAHAKARQEWLELERDVKTGKIDHLPGKSKDCSDAMAATIYGLTFRRAVWARHKIPAKKIPLSLRAALRGEPENAVPDQVSVH